MRRRRAGRQPGIYERRGRERAAGGERRHVRAHPRGPLGTAELAHLLRRLRRAAIQPAGPDQHGERQAPLSRVGVPGRLGRHARGPIDVLVRGRPDRRGRSHVRLGLDGWVWALDARTGQELWRYKHAIPYDVSLCCGNVNRGVAVAKGKVFVVTLNAHVLALDAQTGERVWDRTYGDVRAGESATVAPLVVKNLVIVGSSGGEFGVRGHLDAFDLETGERAWRTYTVPKPGEPGSETWPADGEAWARGGGNPWITCTYDPELNLLYFGTGNPAPDFDGEVRPGDNLYTDSVIAVNPDNGEMRWHYQHNPHDLWDYDSISENILFDLDGRKLMGHFNKNGYAYVLDRTDGALVRVFPFVDRITWGEVDPNGKVTPKVYPEKEGDPVHFYPGPGGGKEWTHAAYSPKTQLFYVPVQDVGATATRRRREFKESIPYWGAGVAVDSENMAGSVSAFDPATGQEAWRWRNEVPMCASVLATGGDLVFAG